MTIVDGVHDAPPTRTTARRLLVSACETEVVTGHVAEALTVGGDAFAGTT